MVATVHEMERERLSSIPGDEDFLLSLSFHDSAGVMMTGLLLSSPDVLGPLVITGVLGLADAHAVVLTADAWTARIPTRQAVDAFYGAHESLQEHSEAQEVLISWGVTFTGWQHLRSTPQAPREPGGPRTLQEPYDVADAPDGPSPIGDRLDLTTWVTEAAARRPDSWDPDRWGRLVRFARLCATAPGAVAVVLAPRYGKTQRDVDRALDPRRVRSWYRRELQGLPGQL